MPFARADLVTNNIFVETSSFQTQTQRLAQSQSQSKERTYTLLRISPLTTQR